MSKVALVVDDSMLIRYTVCRFLEQRGFGVESATNGVEALEILARVQPAVIVTDLQMPKMSGNELITAVKNNLETTGIPIIVLARRTSGLGQTTALDQIETRANFFIYKDIDIEAQLAKTLDELFGQGQPWARSWAVVVQFEYSLTTKDTKLHEGNRQERRPSCPLWLAVFFSERRNVRLPSWEVSGSASLPVLTRSADC